ncbi:Calcium-binding EF hand family protein [Zea mays]|uniref:Calcium-binding EF hand family protein n=1 Tax=Zea mays TaxID=4577 RepID=A0A1D6FY21_MAIZE|nr:Calcium-binding EF hand family protein [Zea mays]AQK96243.1 Calcium-binding EF hand family protein [Zea mays]AQK96244.1 Calcium-binding EF hand family protein [Zea mays]AQK96246.1 Calcium-binding EF hand family protein [Zea mays]
MAPAPAAASAGRKSHVTVLLLYVVCGLILLLLLASYSPRLQPHAHGRSLHRRLKLHPKSSLPSDASSGGNGGQQKTQHQNHHAASFDPTIAELERRLDDKEWEREHYSLLHGGEPDDHMKEWEEFLKEEEDFINDDDRFNIADRIRALFPKIDVAPQDGFVSLDELTAWNLQQARADQHHRSAREMELYNKNGDEIERAICLGSNGGRRIISMRQMQTLMVSLIKLSSMISLIQVIRIIPKSSICSANKK